MINLIIRKDLNGTDAGMSVITPLSQHLILIEFKITRSDQLKKMYHYYAKMMGLSDTQIFRFLFNGKPLDVNSTPAAYHMRDGDVIHFGMLQVDYFRNNRGLELFPDYDSPEN